MAKSRNQQGTSAMAESADGETSGAMRIDPALVRELAHLLTENELTEIEVEDGDRKIKVKREPASVIAAAPAAAPAPAPAPAPIAAASAALSGAEANAEEEVSGTTVKSPMVGTAFLSPEPGANPFVSVGDAVKAGDTLLIVEAMKVMNPITAPSGGVVKKLMVSDGQPVEFDQPLAIIG
jgi:acetyl-CoA carboxylase biotin carboxyl carrier protein